MDTEVKAFMTGEPIWIEAEAPALAALDLMIDHAIRHLPVVDASGIVRGVLSFDDLRAAFPVPLRLGTPLGVKERELASEIAVGEVMTYSPTTVRFDTPLEEAVARMLERRVGCLPVVDEQGRLDGMLTETDLLQALATVLWSMRRQEAPPKPDELTVSLERERAHLVRQLADYGRLERSLTEVRREIPLDLAEQGRNAEEGYLTEQLAELASRRLRAIEHALERAERGSLEVCERCGHRIPQRRLRALPGTTLCIRCSEQAEPR